MDLFQKIEHIYYVLQGFQERMFRQVNSSFADKLQRRSLRRLICVATIVSAIGVGFGISQLEHALQVKNWGADAVIVGSAFVKRLADGTPEQGLQAIAEFCQSLKAAITAEAGRN